MRKMKNISVIKNKNIILKEKCNIINKGNNIKIATICSSTPLVNFLNYHSSLKN